jgi:hypothetical protein
MSVIEDLNLHAQVGGIALKRGADADAVVAARLGFEFKAENKAYSFSV